MDARHHNEATFCETLWVYLYDNILTKCKTEIDFKLMLQAESVNMRIFGTVSIVGVNISHFG